MEYCVAITVDNVECMPKQRVSRGVFVLHKVTFAAIEIHRSASCESRKAYGMLHYSRHNGNVAAQSWEGNISDTCTGRLQQ